jgi:S-adenosylmethionine:tRNA ribosyltransferase-isomerase
MRTLDFNYHLPTEYIAQTPVEPRHDSRLMVMRRDTDVLEHTRFWNLGEYLRQGDVLVINRTKVIPARLFGNKLTGGKVEILMLRGEDACTWEALIGGKHLKVGQKIQVEGGMEAELIEILDGSRRRIRFTEPVEPYLERVGHTPLPPYIHTTFDSSERYQTVYASQPGSAAAPTAGLHFTRELMDNLEARGVRFVEVTLHVGLDTFAPVTEDDPRQHHIHTEWCEVSPDAAQAINAAKAAGGRVVAVGTTSVRTLESAAQSASSEAMVSPFSGATSLFILPGYQFRVVDVMITNFHLPRSTLIMLVSAFAGRERVLAAYQEAVRQGYRFYSFGDAMLIL